MIPLSVEPCFETVRKISPGRPSAYSPMLAKPLQSATRNSKVRALRVDRLVNQSLDDSLDGLRGRHRGRRVDALAVLAAGRERLTDLAIVAVHSDGLEPELPRQLVQRLDVFDRRLLGHVDGLGDRT
jgi:hypothetical protein